MPLLSPKTPIIFFCLFNRLRGHRQLNSRLQSRLSPILLVPGSLLPAFLGHLIVYRGDGVELNGASTTQWCHGFMLLSM